MHRNAITGLAGAGAALLVVALAGCASSSDDAGTTPSTDAPVAAGGTVEELCAAAVEAGQTELIGYVPSTSQWEEITVQFAELCGVTLSTESLAGGTLDTRLQSEVSTGGIQADWGFAAPLQVIGWEEAGYLGDFVPEAASELDPGYIGAGWVTVASTAQGSIHGANVTDFPTTWAEIVDPKYAGKVVSAPPNFVGGFTYAVMGAYEDGIIDDEWIAAFKALNAEYTDFPTAVQEVASGNKEIYAIGATAATWPAMASGAPIKFQFLDHTYGTQLAIANFAEGANPLAYQAFATWLLTDEGQEALMKTGVQGTMPGAAVLEGLDIATYKVIDTATLRDKGGDFTAWFSQQLGVQS